MKKEIEPQTSKLKKAFVALFVDGMVISGECKFIATKTDRFSKEAVFQITLIKNIDKIHTKNS